MFRRTFLLFYKSQYPDMIFVFRTFRLHNQVNCLSNLQLQSICYMSKKAQSLSNGFKCILHPNVNFCATVNDKVENLNEYIPFENFDEKKAKELKRIITFLISKGYTRRDIKKKFSPYLESVDSCYTKIILLSDIDSDLLLLMPLLSLPLTILRTAAKEARKDKPLLKNFPSRIHYLSYNLELEGKELISALIKHSALLTMPFKRLDHKMNVLKSANISSKHLVMDLWIFNYNERLLANRIQSAVNAGMELKPWMLRCSKKYFETMLEKFSETQRILDGESVTTYLAKMLDCGEEYIEHVMEKNKFLKTINIPKLEQVRNFLLEKGYTPQEIRLYPRVFSSSVQTLNRRFEEYKRVKSTSPTISQLCITSKRFEDLKQQD